MSEPASGSVDTASRAKRRPSPGRGSALSPAPFDVCGPLPAGTTVLEASAGTGKTFTIAALAARYVAEGEAELSQLMLVTFGRDATQELRERVRERLVSVERGLREPAAARESPDTVLRHLAGVSDDEVLERRRRLARALAGFDAATIATTHQFCRQMLAGLGVAADSDPDAVFVETIDDLVTEVVDDFYIRKFARDGAGPPAFDRATALTLARRAVGDPHAELAPADAAADTPAHVRHSFACAVRSEVERRKRDRRLYTYDDMLTRLRDALADERRGARERLRARYRVVLVDEFQDTDPIQWEILRTAFHGHRTLVLIGDPKQAIYAFRGADVMSYLGAARAADTHATLDTNRRSDAGLLRALDTVFGGTALGDERIVVRPVESAHPEARLRGAPAGTPLRIRVLRRDGLAAGRAGLVLARPVREVVAADVAADVAALLASGATVEGERIAPGDVAVLVRKNDQGALVRDALAAVGVPAVVSGTASVFGTVPAREWLELLEALEQPRAARVRGAALTCFLGHTAAELCGPGGDALTDRLSTTLREWAVVLRERGVAALLEAVTTGTDLPGRLLARTDGERTLTDLRHVGQALHAAAVDGHLGPAALVEWLRHRIDDAASDVGLERSRRLESDAAAVQIITIHRSKGLEFPVVHVPFGWDRWVPDSDDDVPLLHDGETRVLDVGGPTGPRWKERCARYRAEEAGEDLRLLYVAMTRARCQVVTWWVPATTAPASSLHRLLIGRTAEGEQPRERCGVPADDVALRSLRALCSDDVAVEVVGARAPAGFAAGPGRPPDLAAARFARRLDDAWRRTSYSALTSAAHTAPGVGSEPEEQGTDDEAEVALAPAAGVPALPSPMAGLPVGTGFGTLVHAVLETADLTAADLREELAARAAEHLARRPLAGLGADELAVALVPAVETPLGPLAGGLRLRDVGPRDLLAELEFEFPLAGGDRPRDGAATVTGVAALLRGHLPAGDPLAGYPDVLAALGQVPLRGYLTGSIDAVVRLPDGAFAVVDHKTNWLGPIGPDGPEPLTAAHYAPPRLAEAMISAQYPLQALVYAVALHRFLRWRLAGYAPERHLGGAFYLFLRGMCGPHTPTVDGVPCGVFGWRPPPALVVELSDLLAGAAP